MKDILSFAPTVQGKLAEAALSGDLKPRTILLPLDFGFAALEWWSNMTAYEKALKLLNETETVVNPSALTCPKRLRTISRSRLCSI
jgi:hypothetical protein